MCRLRAAFSLWGWFEVAATRLIALHKNKGKSVAACLKSRTDYAQNPDKTEQGQLVSSYKCSPLTVDEELMLSKRQYELVTGRRQKNDVIAYQIRQSFKPGEITAEEANKVGYELAMRFTKGKYAFLVATHTDREHIHNHIIYNSTALDCSRKFRDFLLSGLAVQRLSDLICLEHSLSVIEIKPYRERQKRVLYPPKESNRDQLCGVIDSILADKPGSYEEFLKKLEQQGYEVKRGKFTSVKGVRQKRFIRFRTLGAGYSEEELKAVLAGKAEHCPRKKHPVQEQKFQMLVDIQAKLAEGKGDGYARWAKRYNLKEMSKTLIFLQENKIGSMDEMEEQVRAATMRYHELGDSIKAAEARMAEIAVMKTHIINYAKTRSIYEAYRKAGYSKRFLEANRESIALHKAAKAAFDEAGLKKLPKVKELSIEYVELLKKKKAEYPSYRKARERMQELMKARADEFSRIQARFKTRLSLSSSSVDEVIQKRVLKKTPEAEKTLDAVYEQENSGMRNLFSFTNAMPDIKGFSGPAQFAEDFPFVPYQFLIMQKIFVEIRKHGNAGKHFSGGERSMLSGFQEAAQKVEKQNEFALVPLFRFYDTVHSFLDSSIRNVIDRCSKAVENHDGLEPMDVDVLKLLYLIRYVNEDIPANLDNLVILMADDIRLEKVAMREKLRGSLDRLMGQNYIGRTGDTYNFLTDEEQDIQKEINLTQVDTGAIVGDIAKIIFGIIYDAKKFRYGKCDFPFDQMVDNTMYGIATGGMRLRFLTAASDATEKTEFRLMNSSKGSEAIVVLGDTPYYESLEASMKIRKYVKQRNVSQMPKSAQDIIRGQQEEATKYEAEASKALVEAIENAKFYADGEHLDIKSGNAKAKIDQTMEYLVSHVYSKLDLIGKNADTDAEIMAVLSGADIVFAEADPNRDAEAAVEEYLEMQAMKHLPTSMADVQSKFSSIPYGWKEIDIAYVVARLIVNQKVTIKYAGTTIQPDNAKLPDMLRKKSEVGKTSISKRVVVSATKMKAVRGLLRDYFDVMDVPADEDGLVKFIAEAFGNQLEHYNELNKRYDGAHKYPDQTMVRNAIAATQEVLNQKKDNIALIDYLLKKEDDLFDQKDAMGKKTINLKHNMHENILYWETLFAHNEKSCRYIPLRHLQKLICFCTRFETLFS